MESCLRCPTQRTVFCNSCQAYFCSSCAFKEHLTDQNKSHEINYLCEECEDEIATEFCENCDQSLCSSCDNRIHNKGKRSKHTKRGAPEKLTLDKIQTLAFITTGIFEDFLIGDSSIENFKTRFLEFMKNTSQTILAHTPQANFFMIILEDKTFASQHEKVLAEALEESNLKKAILVQNYCEETKEGETQGQPSQNFSETKRKVSFVESIMKALTQVEEVYLYDSNSTEQLAELISKIPECQSKKIFQNGGASEQNQSVISLDHSHSHSQESFSQAKQEDISCRSNSEGFNFGTENLLTPESSFSSFDISMQPKVNFDILNFPSKENYHPNLYAVNTEGEKRQDIYDNYNQMEQRKSLIPETQPFKLVEIQGSKKNGQLLQQEIRNFANKGELLILKETLGSRLKEVFQLKTLGEAENIMIEAENKNIIHTTKRKFPNESPYSYIGMFLNLLTLESLAWVVKSIKFDLMTPTEKLILSRIKECYGLKIESNYWKALLNAINSKNLTARCPVYVKQILDPVTGLETSALYLTTEEWVPEDQGQVDENSNEWKALLEFIDNFFREDSNQNLESSIERSTMEQTQNSRWNNSVENILSRSSDGDKVYKISEDVKAVPGGRYGCAQFIKYCGPENLKDLSLGRLSLLVQEAINKGILKYQRTLLVRNFLNDSSTSSAQLDFQSEVLQSLNAERKAKVVSMVKEALLEILMEHPSGVSFAQIPFHLKRKLKFNVDFQELGFPKLKNFLATLKNLVIIESIGTNHTCVKLKEPLTSYKKSYRGHGSLNFAVKKRLGDIDKTGYNTSNLRMNEERAYHNQRNFEMKKFSNPETELRRITEALKTILASNPQGIYLQNLYKDLCVHLNAHEINFKQFNCENFYQFLLQYEDQLVDISAKKTGFFIFPKSRNYWMQGKEPTLTNNFWQKYETPNRQMMYPQTGMYQPQEMGGYDQQQQQPQMRNPQMVDQRNYGPQGGQRFPFPGQQFGEQSTIMNSTASFNNSIENPLMNTSYQSLRNRPPGNVLNDSNNTDFSFYSGGKEQENSFFEKPQNARLSGVDVSTWNSSLHSENEHPQRRMNQHARHPIYPFRRAPLENETSKSELQDNLKFIEELLDHDDKGFSGYSTERSHDSSVGGGFYNVCPNESFNNGKFFPQDRSFTPY